MVTITQISFISISTATEETIGQILRERRWWWVEKERVGECVMVCVCVCVCVAVGVRERERESLPHMNHYSDMDRTNTHLYKNKISIISNQRQ